ncbi:MAG: ParA family protein [Cyanobacteria bacterium J06638_22]
MQKRIAIMSNAGGTGKTTFAVNLAYQLARMGQSVGLLGCDPNGSLTLFAGLDDPPEPKQTLDHVLDTGFSGDYPLYPVWRDRMEGIDAVLGGLVLTQTAKRLEKEPRGAYLLADALEDHPLPHDVLLLDCPGTIERFHEVALSASTHVLVVIRPVDKDIDAGFKLLNWIYDARKILRLKPAPEILGVCPNGFRKDLAMHRDNMGNDPERSLPEALKAIGIHEFPTIRESAHLTNASANGLPLGIWRTGESINKAFEDIAQTIVEV